MLPDELLEVLLDEVSDELDVDDDSEPLLELLELFFFSASRLSVR